MSLNTPSELRLIMEVPSDVDDTSLQAFLDDANLLVVETLTGKGLSDTRMKSIEKYVAAHFAVLLTERGGLTSSRTGQSQDNYLVLSPMGNSAIGGLKLTRYGNQAITLDTTGTLNEMSNVRPKARFGVISEFDQEPPPLETI